MDEVIEIPKEKVGYFRSTERPLEDYISIFSFTPESLKPNAKILDVGSGTYQAFAKGLKLRRPDIEVINVDPTLFIRDYAIEDETGKIRAILPEEKTQRRKEKFGNTIAAIAPDLPFKDNSFDYIFDNHSAFMYFPEDINELRNYLGELIRVTQPRGKIQIFPLDLYIEALIEDPNIRFTKSKNRILELVGKLGISNYEIFTKEEKTKEGPVSRLGIKITKN